MNLRVPIHIQAISGDIKYLPTPEYSTLSSLNLPMNESGIVMPGTTVRIPLGYRIILPRGCIGVMKERQSAIRETPFLVMAGILDCNSIQEDSELESKKLEPEAWPPKDVLPSQYETTRLHPEVVLYVFNCGVNPVEYTKGKSLVQLFVHYVCESQLHVLAHDVTTPVTLPLRYM